MRCDYGIIFKINWIKLDYFGIIVIGNRIKRMNFLKPKWAVEWWELIKTEGIKEFIKIKGWKVVVAFFLFYLIRDVTLYIIIPYLIIDGVVRC